MITFLKATSNSQLVYQETFSFLLELPILVASSSVSQYASIYQSRDHHGMATLLQLDVNTKEVRLTDMLLNWD